MITEYHRPRTLEEALTLLARKTPVTIPLGGGSALRRLGAAGPGGELQAVVDLQALPLNALWQRGNTLELGATVTLQALLEYASSAEMPVLHSLQSAIEHEATYNLRQVATVAGTLVAAGGRSAFATAMLALDANLTLLPGDEKINLGSLLPLRGEKLRGRLITQVSVPLKARLAYHYVARTPADLPLVCAAVARWPSGRTRVALGGFGQAPLLAMDGPDADGAEAAARDAYSQAGDEWASAEYRQEAAEILARRGLQALTS